MLQTQDLSKSYNGHEALKGLNLQVAPGEIYCLLGANGAGKTTTINLFLSFIEPSAGCALVDGIDVMTDPVAARHRLAYIPEQVMLYRQLSGLENLVYFNRLSGRDMAPEGYREVLRDCGLQADAVDRKLGTYSKGMRQKVGVAIAVAKQARALLLDEPTSGLDPKASNEFSQLLVRLREQGAAILMATHDLFHARQTATRIGIMCEGVLRRELVAHEVSHADLERIYLEHMN
ncbi:MAG: ABC transporter ATP-binding protein [Gammaproteobacteria bacterium]|nr:ABC transporter ATP-binding protein [Gammaproteobacteria bacterium]